MLGELVNETLGKGDGGGMTAEGPGELLGDELRRAQQNVATWIEMVSEAGHVHDRLAPVVSQHIESVASRDEILRFVPFMAGLSNQARAEIESTLRTVLIALQSATRASMDERPEADEGGLRSVP